MITIHLQLVAIVFWVASALLVCRAIYWLNSTYDNPDLAPVLGIALAVRDVMLAAIAAGVGFLIFLAFRG